MSEQKQLGLEDFARVQEALWNARSKWHNIGTRLKLDVFELDCINAEPGIGLDEKFNLMVKARLKKMEPCTWRDLYDALNHPTVDMASIANTFPGSLLTVSPSEASVTEPPVLTTSRPVSETEDKGKEVQITRERIDQLQREYIDISVCVAEEMKANVPIKTLRYSVLCLPPNLKKEHKTFVRERKAEVREAELTDDVMFVVGEHYDYLHYSLLDYIIGLYGSDTLKKKMADYVKKIEAFRKETRLVVFSRVCDDEPEFINGRFTTMVSKHQMNWETATLEDVDKFRIQVCRELSLYNFSLNLLKVARGCVEVTWQVPRSLVTYIQNSIKPRSQSMADHHVTTLTIDRVVIYDSSFAMQNEFKVTRLQLQTINTHIGYLMETMSLEKTVPQLVERRILSHRQAEELWQETSHQQKVISVIDAFKNIPTSLGKLPTFCAALVSAGQPNIAEKLLNKFQCLLTGHIYLTEEDEAEVMISQESIAQLPPPTSNTNLITAQIEGTTLTRAKYDIIHSLISSLLCAPTCDLVYAGHTLHPLTLHWHCSGLDTVLRSYILYNDMTQVGIKHITVEKMVDVVIPHPNEIRVFNAAWDGDMESLNSAVKEKVSIDCAEPGQWSSLMVASQNGHVEVVDKLLKCGATIDLQTKNGWSSLMVASLKGHVEVVDKLLQHGAMVDLQKKKGVTALMVASHKGHVDVVKKLLEHGTRIDLQNEGGWSSLMAASQQSCVEVVDMLLQHGARVDLKDENDDTALTIACKQNEVAIVSLLLEAGANPNTCNKAGLTPLLLSVRSNNVEFVQELLRATVDVNYIEEGRMSALMMCCVEGNSEMARLLLDSHSNPDLQQSDTGCTALMFACMRGHLDTVMLLMEYGADSQIRNIEGMMASDIASVSEYPDVCGAIQLMDPSSSQSDIVHQHPDTSMIKKTVKEMISRFHAKVDDISLHALYGSDSYVHRDMF